MKNLSYKYQKPSYQVPKKKLIQRYPRSICSVLIFGSISVLYSRQIYDIFFRPDEDFGSPTTILPAHRR